MARTRTLRAALISAIVLVILYGAAITLYLYWSYWWFDIPLHLLGGFCIGLFSLGLFSSRICRAFPASSSVAVLILSILGALGVGIVWELFEYAVGLTWNAVGNYALDTVKDLVMDLVGGYAAHLWFIARGYHKDF